jgi:hypothetical protein
MKKVLMLVLITILLTGSVYASEGIESNIMDGATGQETQPYRYSRKEAEAIKLKRDKANLEAETIVNTRSYDDGIYKTLDVPVFEQENSYFCGPATTKQVAHYMTGSSHSQQYIANVIEKKEKSGTTMAYILYYLNDNKGLNYIYDQGIANDYSTWLNAIYSSVNNSKPAIIIVKDLSGSVLPYSTSGHYINSSGVDSKYSSNKIRITDPWTPGLGNKWYYASDIHMLNYNDTYTWRRALIW